MALTRAGALCLLMVALAGLSGASTGNNLLYLLFSAVLSALALSALAGWLNLRRVEARIQPESAFFQGVESPLAVFLRNRGRWPSFSIRVRAGVQPVAVESLEPGQDQQVSVRFRPDFRGLNALTDWRLESLFPFGLIMHRRPLSQVELLAFPRLREIRSPKEVETQASVSGLPNRRKGSGDELYGVREYTSSDDSRSINWKLSARLGKPLVNEYCESGGTRVTITVGPVPSEDEISQAASACRYYLDGGSEVRLLTPEGEVDYGKGLLHLERLLKALALLGDGRRPRTGPSAIAGVEPGCDDSAGLRRLTLAGAALLHLSLFLIDEVSKMTLFGLMSLWPAAWFVQERRRALVPDWAWTVLSLAALAYALGVDWWKSGVTAANAHLVIYLLVNRALVPIKKEEMGHSFLILFLAFFLVSGLTISPWYFASFLGFVVFAALWLSRANGVAFPSRLALLKGLGLCLAGELAAAAVLFSVTPRVEGLRRINPFLNTGLDKFAMKSSSVMGFTENVSLGFYGELKKSSARAMRVSPPWPVEGRRAPPLLVRGAAFDAFDGRSWSRSQASFYFSQEGSRRNSERGRAWALRQGQRLLFPSQGFGEEAFEFVLFPMNTAVVFTVGTPIVLEGSTEAAYFDHTDTVRLASPVSGGVKYRQIAASRSSSGFGSSIEGYPALLRERFLSLPPDPRGRIKALAIDIAAGAGADLEKAKAIERHLRREYAYSTFSDGRRDLEDFLFSTRRGNCEYFASAGALLLRHLGIPSRLVTGFLSEEYNEFGRFYDVRQHHAHAWVEAFIPGQGWVVLDPTPPQGLFSASADALTKRMERWFDALQLQWYRRVIGYDQYSQRDTFRHFRLTLSWTGFLGWGRRALEAAFLLIALAAGWHGLRSALAARRAKPSGFYELVEAALRRAGVQRQAHWTPLEFAEHVRRSRPELRGLGELVSFYYRMRYGKQDLSEGEIRRAGELLEQIRSGLA
ncbi:MAG: DUF3488 domain-containing protein [Elusimicrobia bacterium]|nr:DUF3488 domain-containing protein [Elusimicrobiota bacterium]